MMPLPSEFDDFSAEDRKKVGEALSDPDVHAFRVAQDGILVARGTKALLQNRDPTLLGSKQMANALKSVAPND